MCVKNFSLCIAESSIFTWWEHTMWPGHTVCKPHMQAHERTCNALPPNTHTHTAYWYFLCLSSEFSFWALLDRFCLSVPPPPLLTFLYFQLSPPPFYYPTSSGATSCCCLYSGLLTSVSCN